MKEKARLPRKLEKVMDITRRYFAKHGEIQPTTIVFGEGGFEVEEHVIASVRDKFEITDAMVAAAASGATAVAFAAEAWTSKEETTDSEYDAARGEGLVIAYEEPGASYASMCKVNHQQYGPPRLSKWESSVNQPSRHSSARFECIYERARVRRNTALVCEAAETQLMLLMRSDGSCLRNDAGEALVVSSLMMARASVERWSDGGRFRCVPAMDHVDQLVTGGGFRLTSAAMSFPANRDIVDALKAALKRLDLMKDLLPHGIA